MKITKIDCNKGIYKEYNYDTISYFFHSNIMLLVA